MTTGETTSLLLTRAKAGDGVALDSLCRRLVPRLTRWATGRLPGSARSLLDTEDVVQDAVVQSLRHLQSFRPDGSGAFFAYLRQAVTNRIRDQIRRRDVGERALGEMQSPAAAPSPLQR